MKKNIAKLFLLVFLLSNISMIGLAYTDTDNVMFLGNFGSWYYGQNRLGPGTISGAVYKIPYDGYTTTTGKYVDISAVMVMWKGFSSTIVHNDSQSGADIAVIGKTVDIPYGGYDKVTFDCLHRGYENYEDYGDGIEVAADNTSTVCNLPIQVLSTLTANERYIGVKENDIKVLSDVGNSLIPQEYFYYNMLDWSSLKDVIAPLQDKPKVIDAFSSFIMNEIFGKYILEGDSAPSFWFSPSGEKAYITYTKEDSSLVVLETQLNVVSVRGNNLHRWSLPIVVK